VEVVVFSVSVSVFDQNGTAQLVLTVAVEVVVVAAVFYEGKDY
jgi:hypothetical protein